MTFGIIRGEALGWASATVLTSLGAGVALLAAFVRWELRVARADAADAVLPQRGFSATNGLSFAMFFGMFGSIFLLGQFFQVAQGYGPLEAGARTLPWTAMPIFVAPIAGALIGRVARGR